MKLKFETWYRAVIFTLAVLLVWSVWRVAAQNVNDAGAAATVQSAADKAGGKNAPPDASKKSPPPTPQWVKKLSERMPFLQHTLWGIEAWKYYFSLVYVFLAFFVSKLLDFLTRVWLKKWAARTKTTFDDLVLDLLNGPIKVVAFVIFLRIGLDVFQWPELVRKILFQGFKVIVACSLTYMVLKFIDLIMTYWRRRAHAEADREFDQQLLPIIRKSLKVFITVVATLLTLDNLGVNITTAIASLSIGGLAVGLAAQDTLANLFGAVAVFLDKPFRIGEVIRIDAVEGTVESIGMRSTRVRNRDGHLIAIPNKTVGNATIINVTERPHIRSEFNIGLTYDTPVEKIKEAVRILEEVYQAHPMTAELVVSFNKFTDFALNLFVVHVWNSADVKAQLAGIQELNLTIKERFDAEKIEFAFPSQTVYLKKES